jgi:hypothetical protein
MVQLHGTVHPATAGSDLLPSKASPNSSTVSTADSFTAQLATEIEGYLAHSGNGSHFEIDIQKGQDAAGGGSQFTITVKNLGGDAAAARAVVPGASSEETASSPAGSTVLLKATGVSLMDNKIDMMSAPATATAPSAPAIDRSKMTPNDAYWAEQPEDVQALRNMPESERTLAAMELAKSGRAIDVPIMVWGWDPLTTMVERQNYGYTWVPSALQSPVRLPPGLSFPGLPAYDAANPPQGSIRVTTDFAAGTNMQDVYIDPATIIASMSASASASMSASAAAMAKTPVSS